MTPAERITHALAVWPGREVDVAEEVGVSKSRLRVWAAKNNGRYMGPTDGDAETVVRAVKALLVRRLQQLGDSYPMP